MPWNTGWLSFDESIAAAVEGTGSAFKATPNANCHEQPPNLWPCSPPKNYATITARTQPARKGCSAALVVRPMEVSVLSGYHPSVLVDTDHVEENCHQPLQVLELDHMAMALLLGRPVEHRARSREVHTNELVADNG